MQSTLADLNSNVSDKKRYYLEHEFCRKPSVPVAQLFVLDEQTAEEERLPASRGKRNPAEKR